MQRERSNWSGSLRFTPARIEIPDSEEVLAELVREIVSEGRTLRVVGASHSSSPILQTTDTLVSLEKFQGIEAYDVAAGEATIRAGMRVHDVGKALLELGMATPNTGDVDAQMVAGAISTGTHGTGKRLQNLSAMLIGGRMLTGTGDLMEFSLDRDPSFLQASRVALGALGIFTALKLRLVPAFQLQRREWCTHIDSCLAHLDQLVTENRNFDFYWYPRSDQVKLRTLNLPGEGSGDIPYATCVEEQIGWSAHVLPKFRDLKFDEMEYALPANVGPECFQAVRKRVKDRWRKIVGWRVLYRTVAADDAYLSPAYGRDTVTISLHQNAGLPFWEYFKDIEPIFQAYGGRPHWGKKFTLRAAELRPLYPLWDRFLHVRERMDPDGVFLNPYLRELFGLPIRKRYGGER